MTRLYSGAATRITEHHLVDKNKSSDRSPKLFYVLRRAIYGSPGFFKSEDLGVCPTLSKCSSRTLVYGQSQRLNQLVKKAMSEHDWIIV